MKRNSEQFTMADVVEYVHIRDAASAKGNPHRAKLAQGCIEVALEEIANRFMLAGPTEAN